MSTIVPTSSSIDSREARAIRGIIHSGVALLDEWLGGVRAGGSHLFTGGPGSGKSAIALLFADAGLRRGEPVTMLMHARADNLMTHARYLGIDLDTPLRNGRLMLLRYRGDFVRRTVHAASVERIVADLERIVSVHAPSRLVIDTFSPFLMGTPPLGPAVAALSEMIERLAATTVLTFPEDLSAGYDRSLEPLVQGAAAIVRLVQEDAQVRRAELLSLRYQPPAATTMRFVIRERAGVVAEHAGRGERLTLRVP